MTRVLMVSERFAPVIGGLEGQALALGGALRRRGFDVEVLTRRFHGLAKTECVQGIPVHRCGGVHELSAARWQFAVSQVSFLAHAAAFLVRHSRRFDVLHVHGLGPYAGPLAMLARCLRLRSVVKIASQGAGEAGLEGRRFKDIRRLLARSFDAYVALNEQIATALVADGVARDRIVRLPNFVDVERFRPGGEAERGELRLRLLESWAPEGLVVAALGRLEPSKGIDVLLRAVAQVEGPVPLSVVIIGDGSVRRALEGLAAELGLGARVRFAGTVRTPELYLRAVDLFAIPSLSEGMPNCLLEALASGLPVIGTRIPGITDVLSEENGVLVTPGSAEELAAALDILARDALRRKRLAERGRALAERRFSLDSIVDAYCGLYRSLTA